MAMKTVISYVSGTAGDFVVNCGNAQWRAEFNSTGTVKPSATIRHHEPDMTNSQILDLVESLPYDFVGSHSVEKWLYMPVRAIWLTVPDREHLRIWAARDAVTRDPAQLMGRHGTLFETIVSLVLAEQGTCAAELYLDWLHQFNWTLMQMRLVQSSNKVDISRLLTAAGIDDLIQQMPELQACAEHCVQFHNAWLVHQQPMQDQHWVLNHLAQKLTKMVHCH